MDHAADLVPLFTREFGLCKVSPDDLVGVVSAPGTRPEYAAAAATAARSLGADVFEVRVPGMGWDVAPVVRGIVASVPALAKPSPLLDAVRAALTRATFVVDLIPDTILHVPLRDELLEAGARVLTIVEPPDALERMFPTLELKDEVTEFTARVARVKEMSVTSRAGTDISYAFTDTPLEPQYGYADEPGHWDHWPSALVAHYPIDGSANGTVVLDRGDAICHMKRYVESPVALGIENGYIVSIEGGLDAELIEDYLRSWNESEVFATSHIGFGMHPNAQWTALEFYDKQETTAMDARCVRGVFLFSTGPNRYTGRFVEAHMDLALRGCTVLADGEPLVEAGVLATDVARS
jgi:2,5-dihydroxypyridine 5,6-dioxygenase